MLPSKQVRESMSLRYHAEYDLKCDCRISPSCLKLASFLLLCPIRCFRGHSLGPEVPYCCRAGGWLGRLKKLSVLAASWNIACPSHPDPNQPLSPSLLTNPCVVTTQPPSPFRQTADQQASQPALSSAEADGLQDQDAPPRVQHDPTGSSSSSSSQQAAVFADEIAGEAEDEAAGEAEAREDAGASLEEPEPAAPFDDDDGNVAAQRSGDAPNEDEED